MPEIIPSVPSREDIPGHRQGGRGGEETSCCRQMLQKLIWWGRGGLPETTPRGSSTKRGTSTSVRSSATHRIVSAKPQAKHSAQKYTKLKPGQHRCATTTTHPSGLSLTPKLKIYTQGKNVWSPLPTLQKNK